jgi:hypothetical protein
VLRRIFGTRRDEVKGGWRKLHNKGLHNLYSSPSIIRIMKSRRMRWAGHVARMEMNRHACRILVGKPELGLDWIDLAQNRDQWRALLNKEMNLRIL